jgi:NAD-dependent SIR2 family protein deacetylase
VVDLENTDAHSHASPAEEQQCEICKLKIPFNLPKEIIEATVNRKLVIFAGAGISTEARRVFNRTFYENILGELKIGSKRPRFSDLMSLYCKRKSRRMLLHRIKARFDYMKLFPEVYRDATRFHCALCTIPFIEEIVTTNWDDLFERECDATPIVAPDDFAVFSDVPGRKVFKLHGSVANYGSIVATAEDYQICYRRLRTGVIGSVLKVLLASKTVVFVGYSFQDEDFQRIYRLLNREVKQLLPSAYAVTLDRNAKRTLTSLKMEVTPIITDATFFLETLKAELVRQKLMLPDERYHGLLGAYYQVAEAQNKIYGIDVRSHPENIFSLVYQDGLMHGLEDVMGSKKSGYLSDGHKLGHMIQSYQILQKRYLAARNYWEVAYVEGFMNGLVYFLSSNKRTPKLPLCYLFGCGDITNLRDYTRLARNARSQHKSAYSFAERIASVVHTESVSFHHSPFL